MDSNAAAKQYQVIVRDYAAPPDVVWAHWMEPALLKQWFAQENCDIPLCTNDLRVGGRLFQCVRGNAGTAEEWNVYCGWTYTEIVPERRFAALGFFADEVGHEVPPSHYGATVWPEAVEIFLELEPHHAGTRLTYRETVLPIPKHDEFAHQRFDQLAALLEKADG
jgi:uncharacterized protein YndB with AHSA1/START domain